jgi:hypothetical protein
MAKVGQVVTIPTGSYCNITVDSGEKIVVNHEPGAALPRTRGSRSIVSSRWPSARSG